MNVAVPLANDGYFFARPETIGCTDDELKAAERGEITPERVLAIRTSADEAIMALARCEHQGRC